MSDFVVRGIDRHKYMAFRGLLTIRDVTLSEWLEPLMDKELATAKESEVERAFQMIDEGI